MYGEHPRRARALTAAPAQLTTTFETSDRLGARPWWAYALAELCATGRTGATGRAGAAMLTPREPDIVEMAAAGLSKGHRATPVSVAPHDRHPPAANRPQAQRHQS